MNISAVEESQRQAARVVGLTYLLVLAPAMFAEFVPAHLVVANNVAETARNIVAHERLFRVGIASNLAAFAADGILITALYVVLRSVNRGLALLAVFWGLIETTILVTVTLNDFDVLRVLSGADYLRAFEADRLQTLARLSIGAHGTGYQVGLMFAGLRSTVFAYLWLRSGYIPRALAVWGVFSSVVLAVCTFAFVVFPELRPLVTVGLYGGPIFLFESAMGCWLLLRGLRPYQATE